MRLQTRIVLIVLPLILLAIGGLGGWAFFEMRGRLFESTYRYLDIVLKAHISEHLTRRTDSLKLSGLEEITFYVESYQQVALDSFEQASGDEAEYFVVFDAENTVLFAPPAYEQSLRDTSWAKLARQVQVRSAPVTIGYDTQGTRRVLYVARYFSPWQWTVLYQMNDDALMRGIHRLLWITCGVAGGCVTVVFIGVLMLSRKFLVRPVRILVQAAKSLSRQEALTTIEVSSPDELNTLARSMEQMAEAIQTHNTHQLSMRHELQRTNRQMAEEIAKRKEIEQQITLQNQHLDLAVKDKQQEITERKEAEKRLKASLTEKEVLLRELYHRTKNTLQVIRSMLLLQAGNTPDNESVQKLVQDTENRIMAIALVHQKLYQSQDLSRIPMQEYLRELGHLIIQSSIAPPQNISLVVESAPLSLLLDTAIPCGLIINELLSNALKYAFPGEQPGEIVIRLVRNGSEQLELTIIDNGVGVPPGFDFRAQQTLGLQTVFAIAEQQMQGNVRFVSGQGVTCIIEFPDTLYTERV